MKKIASNKNYRSIKRAGDDLSRDEQLEHLYHPWDHLISVSLTQEQISFLQGTISSKLHLGTMPDVTMGEAILAALDKSSA